MDADERAAAEEYDRTGKLPRYYAIGREPYSAKSGYLRFRKIYGGSDTVLLSGTHPPHAEERKRRDDIAASNEPVGASTKTG